MRFPFSSLQRRILSSWMCYSPLTPLSVSSTHFTSLRRSSSTSRTHLSLSKAHESIAGTWVSAVTNKMLQPHHVSPRCKRLVRWRCPSCSFVFSRRINEHVLFEGECPRCSTRPKPMRQLPRSRASTAKERRRSVDRRALPSQPLAADGNAIVLSDRTQRSVSDDNYLSQCERRILLPMLAKNFEKERHKISPDEMLYVSPKLDGIRCIVSYNRNTGKLLFFSRVGTLFECCDHLEPALKPLFEWDPSLVLDGELYNDSGNTQRLLKIKNRKQELKYLWPHLRTKMRRKSESKDVVSFDMLTSAVRTTRSKMTPHTATLQRKVQYHLFDVLYSTQLSSARSPFSDRLNLLKNIFLRVNEKKNIKRVESPSGALSLVPAVLCCITAVDSILCEALKLGYEGVMVRRDSLLSPPNVTAKDHSGGYAFGQRSGTLLKYKLMQDDEFLIVDTVEGRGKLTGCLGAFVCRANRSPPLTFSVSPAIPEEKKRDIWVNGRGKTYVGKVLTVQFQELTSDGIPRFPVGKSVRGSKNGSDWV